MTSNHEHLNNKSGSKVACGLLSLALFTLVGCDNYEVLVDDLLQKDAMEVLVLLRDKNIEARKESHTTRKSTVYQIMVKKSQADNALRILVYNHLPKTDRAGLRDVYPPGSSGILPTKSDELARLTMAMQGEIEALLKVIPGITDAHVVFSHESLLEFNKTLPKKTASVTLIYHPQKNVGGPPLSDKEVQTLIAASISGLLADDVTVVQKMIRPIEFVDGVLENLKSAPEDSKAIQPEAKESHWYLMVITIVALITAAYGAFRVFWQKRMDGAVNH